MLLRAILDKARASGCASPSVIARSSWPIRHRTPGNLSLNEACSDWPGHQNGEEEMAKASLDPNWSSLIAPIASSGASMPRLLAPLDTEAHPAVVSYIRRKAESTVQSVDWLLVCLQRVIAALLKAACYLLPMAGGSSLLRLLVDEWGESVAGDNMAPHSGQWVNGSLRCSGVCSPG